MTPSGMEALRSELLQEAQATRRMLERVPPDRLRWRPHKKSMTLGQLARHVAALPGDLHQMAQAAEFDAAMANFDPPTAESVSEILALFDAGIASASGYLASLDQATAAAPWRLVFRGREVFAVQRIGLLRTFLLNHWYHHRGQLSVYLRLLDVPLPVVYGRTADENPFG